MIYKTESIIDVMETLALAEEELLNHGYNGIAVDHIEDAILWLKNQYNLTQHKGVYYLKDQKTTEGVNA